jgi:hypothetical protein
MADNSNDNPRDPAQMSLGMIVGRSSRREAVEEGEPVEPGDRRAERAFPGFLTGIEKLSPTRSR